MYIVAKYFVSIQTHFVVQKHSNGANKPVK